MTFLDSNIILKIVDSTGTSYKVQLSKNHSSYIAKEHVKLFRNFPIKAYYLSSDWKVYGDSLFDFVSISLDEKLPYASRQEINPSKIVIDVFGATSNTNWITQLKSAQEIKSVYYEQLEDDVLRITIALTHSQHWGYAIYYDTIGYKLLVKVRRPPAVADIKKLKIAIDAGHGGQNSGADGIRTHILEKDYTLLLLRNYKPSLKKRE